VPGVRALLRGSVRALLRGSVREHHGTDPSGRAGAGPARPGARTVLKRLAFTLLALALLAASVFAGVGGTQGVLLLYARLVVREQAAPPRAVTWASAPPTAPGAGRRPPNVVLIVADDLGINDLTFAGGGVAGGAVPTPRIDSIARDGVDFRTGYAGNATCSPSRAALLTGRYPTRFGFEFTPVPVAFSRLVAGHVAPGSAYRSVYHSELERTSPPYERMALPASEVTIAKLLKSAGYRTMHVGKWHLGETPESSPNAHGFDDSLGFMAGASMFLSENHPDVVNSRQGFDPIDQFLWAAHPYYVRFNGGASFQPARYMTDYLTDEAIAAISANRNRPFFLYLAYNAPHTPLQALRDDWEALGQIRDPVLRVYAAMIRSLDRNVGRVLDALAAQGLADDTLVIFTSDNGGAHYVGLPDLNKPYRGWKATFYEGGVRVPFFMRWPRAIPKRTAFEAPVSHFDVFATVAAAAGVAPPSDRPIDGVDLMPFVAGARPGRPHETLFWRSGDYRAIRSGDWKLQVVGRPAHERLFLLSDDPTERRDRARAEPGRVAELRAQLAGFERAQAPRIWPSLIEVPITVDKTLKERMLADDEVVYWWN